MIKLINKLHQFDQKIYLTIIGYCAHSPTFEKLQKTIQNKSYIKLIGGNHLVPHSQIIEKIKQADCGFISYQSNPSTDNCIPTKLYEYLAHHLPIICVQNPLWENTIKKYQAGICENFENAEKIYHQLNNITFYPHLVDNSIFSIILDNTMKQLITLLLLTLSFASFSQEHSKIELAFIDFTENDSLFFNTNLPENEKDLRQVELYFKLDGKDWMKVSKAKKELHFLVDHEASSKSMKKHIRMNRWGQILFLGGIPVGITVAFVAPPIYGIVTMVGSAGVGGYLYNRSKKHLRDAVIAYNKFQQ